MLDHDQRFKNLIQEFFGDFLSLFFAPWAERLDCAAVEWLDKEVFPYPPGGPRRIMDLVGRVPARLASPRWDKIRAGRQLVGSGLGGVNAHSSRAGRLAGGRGAAAHRRGAFVRPTAVPSERVCPGKRLWSRQAR